MIGDGGGSSGGRIAFEPRIQLQRPGLLLSQNRVYAAFVSHGDNSLGNYHGWILSFSMANPGVAPEIFNTTPDPLDPPDRNSDGNPVAAAGIWQSGYGIAADEQGEIFFETGNGNLNADLGRRNVGDAFVRLSADLNFVPAPQNFFAPSSQGDLLADDLDLGSGGAMLIPDQLRSHTPHLLVGGGKTGILYLLNRDNLGGFTGRNDSQAPNRALQNFPSSGDDTDHGIFCGPAYWESIESHFLFYTRIDDHLHRLKFGLNPSTGSTSWLAAAGDSADSMGSGNPCSTPSVSSDGTTERTGIVWLLRRQDNTLRAYNADSVSLLWHSRMRRRDALDGGVVKFSLPIVADGRVFLGTRTPDGSEGSVMSYGLLPEALVDVFKKADKKKHPPSKPY